MYEWILFDADDTLFHFDSFGGLHLMFSRLGVKFTKQDYEEYQAVNKPLWVLYQNGEINTQQLQIKRFDSWSKKLQIPPQALNSFFLTAMVDVGLPLDGAENLLKALKGKAKLGIITNGFVELHHARLERTKFKEHFHLVVISEQVGIAKPDRGIFDHALTLMGNPPRNKVLMVGDTLESDILGGNNAGLDTCWLNVSKKPIVKDIKPKYQVSSLKELENLLVGSNEYDFNTVPSFWVHSTTARSNFSTKPVDETSMTTTTPKSKL
ncbi:MAG: pyrimidine 5'-nucleotidase [Proteobacteria bacterium]|nr:pyrimidine 5'-nucleotidase [Pseudomonadota bacterium]